MVTTKYDLGVEYLGGLRKPTADDVGKLAVVALDSLGNPNFEYLEQTASVADDTFATTLAPFLRGVGLTVDSNGKLRPRTRPRRLLLQDYFISGNTSSGSIGALGWNLLGSGTPVVVRGGGAVALSSSSRLELRTGSTTNNRAVLKLGETETRTICEADDFTITQCVFNLNNALTNKRFFFGFIGDSSQEPSAATDCLGIYYDSAVHANYQVIARAAGVGTPTVTATAAIANASRIATIFQASPGTYQFYIANTLVGTISAGVPTAPVDVAVRVETLAAATAAVRFGYFGAVADVGNQYADDAFLEV